MIFAKVQPQNSSGFVLPVVLFVTAVISGIAFIFPKVMHDSTEDTARVEISDGMTIDIERPEPPFAAVEDLRDFDSGEEENSFIEEASPSETYSLSASAAYAGIGERVAKTILAPIERTKTFVLSTRELGMTREQIIADLIQPFNEAMNPSIQEQVHREVQNGPSASGLGETNPQAILKGNVELKNGLAMVMSTDQILVFREVNGTRIEQGQIQNHQGAFEIFVDRLEGQLVGELRSMHGHLLGRGHIRLDQLNKEVKYHGDINIPIFAQAPGLRGRVLAQAGLEAPSVGRAVVAARVSVAESPLEMVSARDGRFEEQNVMEGSIVLAKIMQKGFRSLLAPLTAGIDRSFWLPSEISINKIPDAQHNNFVFGRVLTSGQPVADAKIEVVSPEKPLQVIYFNALGEADASLSATSLNGRYAIVGIRPGIGFVQAKMHEAASEPTPIILDERSGYSLDIEFTKSKSVNVKIFDAFQPATSLGGEIRLSGSPSPNATVAESGSGTLNYVNNHELLMTEADANSKYVRTRVLASRDQNVIYYPMVETSWLAQIYGKLRINQVPGRGVVVGFVQGHQNYQVVMDDLGLTRATRVVYFDSRGKVVNGAYGIPGGGFLLYNLPIGLRTIAIQQQGSERYYFTLAQVEESGVAVVNQSLR